MTIHDPSVRDAQYEVDALIDHLFRVLGLADPELESGENVKFFDFVDVNGDRAVEIRELDDARAYLGLQPLDAQDHDSLVALCNEDEELEFDVIVNFVTIFKLKAIIKEYQRNRGEGLSLDASLHSSFHKKR